MPSIPRRIWTPELDEELRRLSLDHSQREIAEVFGVARNTVRKRQQFLGIETIPMPPGPKPKLPPRKVSNGIWFISHRTDIGHPYVRMLFRAMNSDFCSIGRLAAISGVPRGNIQRWKWLKGAKTASLNDLEACFNVFGMTLSPHNIVKTGRPKKVKEE